mgnify:CR=1 FL=1
MKYDVKEKLEWTVIFLFEFGHKYGLTMKQAFNYLSRFKGIDFIDINSNLAPNGLLQNSYDGIHLNADAYLAWRDAIIKAKG